MLRLITAILLILMSAGLAGCSRTEPPPADVARACEQIQTKLDAADAAFVAHVREIRTEHILLVDYDQKMIDALTAYRDKVRTMLEEEENANRPLHCSGQMLTDVEQGERPRLDRVASYLMDFQRALHQDPQNAYMQ
jgi:hypothetical protein